MAIDTDEQVFTNCTTGGPVLAYVKDGHINRIEPLRLGPDDAGSWTIEARGKKVFPGQTGPAFALHPI